MARAFVALRGADPDDRDALSAAVQDAATELQAGLADRSTYSKTEAAHLLDVSSTTLEEVDRPETDPRRAGAALQA